MDHPPNNARSIKRPPGTAYLNSYVLHSLPVARYRFYQSTNDRSSWRRREKDLRTMDLIGFHQQLTLTTERWWYLESRVMLHDRGLQSAHNNMVASGNLASGRCVFKGWADVASIYALSIRHTPREADKVPIVTTQSMDNATTYYSCSCSCSCPSSWVVSTYD